MKIVQISKQEKAYSAKVGANLVKFSTSVPFEASYSYAKSYKLTGTRTFTPKTTGAIPGAKTVYRIVGNGTATLTFPGINLKSTSGAFVVTDDILNILEFTYDGTDFWVDIYQID